MSLSPNFLQQVTKDCLNKGLVRMLPNILAEGTNQVTKAPTVTFSWTKWWSNFNVIMKNMIDGHMKITGVATKWLCEISKRNIDVMN